MTAWYSSLGPHEISNAGYQALLAERALQYSSDRRYGV
jgi:hypothetical protein